MAFAPGLAWRAGRANGPLAAAAISTWGEGVLVFRRVDQLARTMTVQEPAKPGVSRAVREAIQRSDESLRVLARRHGLNPKTVAKWKARTTAESQKRGPKPGRHGKLTAEEEDIIVRFREHTLLPLDDCLYALQAQIPHLSRTSLHRCLQRHGISRLPADAEAEMPPESLVVASLGHLHLDCVTIRSSDGTHGLFNAIDQASKFVFVRMGADAGADAAAGFLHSLVARVPFRIQSVTTQAAEPFFSQSGESLFARACRKAGIVHRLSPTAHPWMRGQGARMGRLIKDSPTFSSGAYVADLLRGFVEAYNCRRRLKTLGGRTPRDFVLETARQRPDLFLRDPDHELVGLEIMGE